MNDFSDLEALRKKAINKIKAIVFVFAFAFVLTIVILIVLKKPFVIVIIVFVSAIFPVAIITFIVAMISSYKNQKQYKLAFKQKYIKKAFSEKFIDMEYQPENHFSEDEVSATALLREGNVYRGNDLLIATYNGVRFRQCDMIVQRHTSSGDSSTTTTYFNGVWIQAKPPQAVNRNLYIRINDMRFRYARKIQGKNIYVKQVGGSGNFKGYEVTSNTLEVPNDITEMLFNIVAEVDTQKEGNVIVGIGNGLLNVLINTHKDRFSPPLFKPITQAFMDGCISDTLRVCKILDLISQ